MGIDYFLKNLLDLFLSYMEINLVFENFIFVGTIHKSKILWKVLIENKKTYCCLYKTTLYSSICKCHLSMNINLLVKSNLMIVICKHCTIHVTEVMSKKIDWSTKNSTIVIFYVLKPDVIIHAKFGWLCLRCRNCKFLNLFNISVYCIRNYRCNRLRILFEICKLLHCQVVYTKDHIL